MDEILYYDNLEGLVLVNTPPGRLNLSLVKWWCDSCSIKILKQT